MQIQKKQKSSCYMQKIYMHLMSNYFVLQFDIYTKMLKRKDHPMKKKNSVTIQAARLKRKTEQNFNII